MFRKNGRVVFWEHCLLVAVVSTYYPNVPDVASLEDLVRKTLQPPQQHMQPLLTIIFSHSSLNDPNGSIL